MPKIEPGKYLAKIKDYAITETSAGDPQVVITFTFIVEDDNEMHLNWYGSLKSAESREITFDTLFRCGFTGQDISLLAKEEYDGHLQLKIKWVNLPSSKFYNRLSQNEVHQKLLVVDIKTELLKSRDRFEF